MFRSAMKRAGVALVLLVLGAGLRADCLLKTGDRMVFLGDSITEQRMYTRYVMNYFALRYPGAKIEFRNAGWGGDTAVGGLKRLTRDVLDLKPTLVSICYGMNDAGVTSYKQEIYDRYIAAMKDIITELRKRNIRVVLLTPGCVDESRKASLVGYNATLGRFAEQLADFAAKENIPIFNIHTAMLDVQTRAKASDPGFVMINDGVHPGQLGHVVMAYGLLKALGCVDKASALTIDASAGKATCDRCKVTDLKVTSDAISFTRTDEALPVYFEDSVRNINYFPGADEINNYNLKVTGLKPGKWDITVHAKDIGVFSSDELANGVNLAGAPGPWKQIGDEANKLAIEQEDIYYTRWRQISLVGIPGIATPEKEALLKKLDAYIAATETDRMSKAVGPRAWRWTLKLAQ